MTSAVRTIEGVFVRRSRKARAAALTSFLPPGAEAGRVARVSRLLALAIRFEQLLSKREVRDYAELARLGHVSRARLTQVMNLLLLAPDIQEEILFLPRIERGHDPIHLRQLQPIALVPRWSQQRLLWRALLAGPGDAVERRERSLVNRLEVAFRAR